MPNYLLNPSAHGYPDATNTGVPDGANLDPSGPIVTSQEGQVIEDLEIEGDAENPCILVRHPNVTIRRCRLIGTSTGGGVIQVNNATGMKILHSEGFCSDDDAGTTGGASFIGEDNYYAEGVYLHDIPEGFRTFGDAVTLYFNYIHRMWVRTEGAHGDCVQSVGGGPHILRNTIIADWRPGAEQSPNAALIVGTEFASGSPVIRDNLLDGGGFTFQFGQSGGFVFTNPIVVGNRFGRGFEDMPGPDAQHFGPFSNNNTLDQMVGLQWYNVYDDDNSPIPTGFNTIFGGMGLPAGALAGPGVGTGHIGAVVVPGTRRMLVTPDDRLFPQISRFTKDPDAKLDYLWDWTGYLAPGEFIQSVEVTAGGVNLESVEHDTTTVTVWVGGGVHGVRAVVSCRVTTNQGRIDERSMRLYLKDR